MSDKRSNSWLTDGQRRFLEGDGSGYHRQTQKDYKEALEERIPAGLRDGKLIWEEWDGWDENARMEMFEENLGDPEFEEALACLIALIYSGTGEAKFRNLLQRGVRKAENRARQEITDDVRIEFSVDTIPTVLIEDALNRYRKRGNLSEMSDAELAAVASLLRRYKGIEAAKDALDAWEEKKGHLFDE